MKQTAVVIIARKLGLQRGLVLQRRRRSSQLCLKILCLRTTIQRRRVVQITHAIVEVDLLAVVVDQRFLLNIGLVTQVGVRVGALLVGPGWCILGKRSVEGGVDLGLLGRVDC